MLLPRLAENAPYGPAGRAPPSALENVVLPAGIRHGYPSDPNAKRKRTTTVMPYKSSKKATMLISTAEKPKSGTRIRSFSSSLSMGVILVHSCFMATLAKQGSHARGQQHKSGQTRGLAALNDSARLTPDSLGRFASGLKPDRAEELTPSLTPNRLERLS